MLEKRLQHAQLQRASARSAETSVIPRRQPSDHAPLSFAQQRLWFLYQLEPDNSFYNIPLTLHLRGTLHVAALEQTLNELIRRHEVLRTTFVVIEGEPQQLIHLPQPLTIIPTDLSALPDVERETTLAQLVHDEAVAPFDLSRGPLLRVQLLRLSVDEHVLSVTMHHIISDGWSLGVLVREVAALYEAYLKGEESPLPELPIQYADYSVWQRNWLTGAVLDAQLSYWREQLAGAPAALELPTDRPRPPLQSFRGDHYSFALSPALSTACQALARLHGLTLFMLLLSGLQLLLSKYSGQTDVVTGTPLAHRQHPATEALIGFFINTLVLRTRVSAEARLPELLAQVREVCLGAYAHQDLPFEKLVEELQPEREVSRAPLFQVMMVLQNAPLGALQLPGVEVRVLDVAAGGETAKFDLLVAWQEGAGGLLGATLEYNTDLFDAATVERMAGHYEQVLTAMVEGIEQRVWEVQLMRAGERAQVLEEWNASGREYPRGSTIVGEIGRRARERGEAVAVECGGARLSYTELERRANQLGRYLRRVGVGAEARVGVLMERGVEMVVGLLGALKAGGAYVPLDAQYPAERLRYMVEDSGVSVLLTQQHLVEHLPEHNAQVFCLDSDWEMAAIESDEPPEIDIDGENPAYVIYTSGSTGRPKGVMVKNRSLVNLCYGLREFFDDDAVLNTALITSISFDISVNQIFPTLLFGKTLHVITDDVKFNSEALARYVAEKEIHLMDCVPSYLNTVLNDLEARAIDNSLKYILIGGEKVERILLQKAFAQLGSDVVMVNIYGLTEITDINAWGRLTSDDVDKVITIGKPLDNTKIYITDRHYNPQPIGVTGELCIGGEGLSRGYLNRPDLTAEKFVVCPFGDGEVMCRTGDLGRWLPDGRIELFGRIDHQVKIRGFRIEVREIEAALIEHPSVRESVVIAREDAPGEKRLVAYVTADGSAPGHGELRRFVKERLPDFMVPSAFVLLEALPLTPNGKVNRNALPAPEQLGIEEGVSFIAPRTPTEEILAGIWAQVMRLSRVSTEANFFDLGGHSLLATQVVARVRETFRMEVSLRQLFAAPTITELAQEIERIRHQAAGLESPPLLPVNREQPLPLSFAQQRLWFLDKLEPHSAFYNIPAAVRLVGPLRTDALARTLGEIVRRHEVLRTTFVVVEGEPQQLIHPPQPLTIIPTDLSTLPEAEKESTLAQLVHNEAVAPFDLSRGPLLRVRLLRLSADEHVLSVTMHHIISDGWSMGVLVREVAALYEAYLKGEASTLPELPIQYADYAVWQREWLAGAVLEQQLSYWREQLADIPAVIELPTDRPRPPVQTFRGAHESLVLTAELSEELRVLSRQERATLFMTLLAAWQTLLWRYAGQDDVLVGTPVAGRNRVEVENLIGFFINMLVLRTRLRAGARFTEILREVREISLDAYAHQDIPFEQLVEHLEPERTLSHAPLFQVMFILQNTPQHTAEMAGLRLSAIEMGGQTAKFDLSLAVVEEEENGGRLGASLEYNTDLFEQTTIRRMLQHLQELLGAIVAAPGQSVSQLPLLTAGERQQLLVQWNDTFTQYEQRRQSLHRLCEVQAERTPDVVALVFEDEELTFAELNRRANQLAHHLRGRGVGPDVLVGVLMERSVEMVVGLLGILKAGGAYVPLDVSSPSERLSLMLKDAAPPVLLTQAGLLERLADYRGQTLCLDSEWESIATAQTEENPLDLTGADNLAYVIYTSGSTGQPKAVMNTHGAIVNRLLWMQDAYRLSAADRVLQKTPYSFDVSVWEFFWPLLSGARLVVAQPEGHRDAAYLVKLIVEQGITTTHFVPSMLQLFVEQPGVEDCRSLRRVICSGEALTPELCARFFQRLGAQLHNLYGPTEAAIDVTFWECEPDPPLVPIGRPIANIQTYVLDRHLQSTPVGVSGELYIGGVGPARGYLRRPDLTAEKFVPDPFASRPGSRLYKSGDLVRYRDDGEIIFIRRIDRQVKVRGFRIELGEIENALAQHPAIGEAVVAAREDRPGEMRLVAYVVARQSGQTPPPDQLRSYLQLSLPEYMIPSAFVPLDELPLTSHGKVDRRALPAPKHGPDSGQAFVAPRDVLELKLVQIWEEVLDIRPVSVRQSFFELGGHSLLAIRLLSRIEQALGQSLPLNTLFQSPTVEHLAALLRRQDAASTRFSTLVPIQTGESSSPFFCVHPSGGTVLCYAALSRHLGPDQPFYGLQSQGLWMGHAPHRSVEEMAAHYVAQVRTVQPAGPYLLGGWSLGGVVAFEMAHQLQAQGQAVSLLALIDAPAPGLSGELPPSKDASLEKPAASKRVDASELLVAFAQDIGLAVEDPSAFRDELKNHEPVEQVALVLDRAIRAQIVPPGTDPARMHQLLDVLQANLEAARNYVARPYEGRVTLFVADERRVNNPENLLTGWKRLLPAGFEVIPVPGTHFTMMQEPHVEALAEGLRDSLMRTPGGASSQKE